MDDEAIWRRRFLISMLARFAGLLILLFGMAVTFTDLMHPGGLPQLGAVLVIVGAIGSVVAPRLVRKRWERE